MNAGLVLASPYLQGLFTFLGLLDGDAFVEETAAGRAAQILEVLVHGRADAPEYRLSLNKLLCGLPIEAPVARWIEVDEEELEAIESLLQAMIEHWGALGGTSVAGLRESFLQRRGTLTRKEDAWHLQVEQRAFDMLLDHVPWTFKTVRHPWMSEVIHVEWLPG